MAYRKKAYTLKEEITKNGTRYFIGFKDRQGNCHELEVSKQFFIEFRQIEAEIFINGMSVIGSLARYGMKR